MKYVLICWVKILTICHGDVVLFDMIGCLCVYNIWIEMGEWVICVWSNAYACVHVEYIFAENHGPFSSVG